MYKIHRQWTVHLINIFSCTKNTHLCSYGKVCTIGKCRLKFSTTITSINSTVQRQIHRIVEKFCTTGSLVDKRKYKNIMSELKQNWPILVLEQKQAIQNLCFGRMF